MYIARGYPTDLVNSWIKNYLAIRWANRLGVPESAGDVFVLKTSFNPAWSRFNVQKLGQIVKEAWISNLLNENFERPRSRVYHTRDAVVDFNFGDTVPIGPYREVRESSGISRPLAGPFSWVVNPRIQGDRVVSLDSRALFDVRKTDFFDRKFLVSRKRTRNLGDLVSMWKKSVLSTQPAIDDCLNLYLDDIHE
jgi:hypothetical protein